MTEALERIGWMINRPERWDFSDCGELFTGVDLGTYKTIAIVVDEEGRPRAAAMRRAEVVRSGLILDYIGALTLVRDLMAEIRSRCPRPLEKGATSYPPRTETANIETTSYILQGAGLEVLKVLDEPTAANRVLRLEQGVIVDVGGGTTGVAVIRDGEVVYSHDEATGGVHLSLVLAGHFRVSFEEAERIKIDGKRAGEILPLLHPVIEKIASIVASHLEGFPDVEQAWLVGGTCELADFPEIVARNLGLKTLRPKVPQVITPFGIALSCLEGNAGDVSFGS